MAEEVEGIVLYEDIIEDRSYIGIFCKKYPTREINVFADEETSAFAKPGRCVYLSFSRLFERMKPNLVLEMDIVGVRECAQKIDYTANNKKLQQVQFQEQVYFAKDDSEYSRLSHNMVFAAAFSPEFGWVLMLKKHLKDPSLLINTDKAYNVVIARPPNRLSQSLVDQLGCFMFCIDIVGEIEDPKVYNFLNEVSPIKRNFGNVAAPTFFSEEMPTDVVCVDGPLVQLLFVFQNISDGAYKVFDTQQSKVITVQSSKRLNTGSLYFVDAVDQGTDANFYSVDHANSLIYPLKGSFEFEAEVCICRFDGDIDNFIWKAYADTIFGTVLFLDVPENYIPDALYTVRAVFSPDDVLDGYVWYAHRYCRITEDTFIKVVKFTPPVAEILKDYDEHSQLSPTPQRAFMKDSLKDEDCVQTEVQNEMANEALTEEVKQEVLDHDTITPTAIEDDIKPSSGEEITEIMKEKDDGTSSLIPIDGTIEGCNPIMLDDGHYNSTHDTEENDSFHFFLNDQSISCSYDTVKISFVVIEVKEDHLVTFSPEHKYGMLVKKQLEFPDLLIGKWIQAESFLTSSSDKYSFISVELEKFVQPLLETVVVNGINESFLLLKVKVPYEVDTSVELSASDLFAEHGRSSYCRYIGDGKWKVFDSFLVQTDSRPQSQLELQRFVSPDFETPDTSFYAGVCSDKTDESLNVELADSCGNYRDNPDDTHKNPAVDSADQEDEKRCHLSAEDSNLNTVEKLNVASGFELEEDNTTGSILEEGVVEEIDSLNTLDENQKPFEYKETTPTDKCYEGKHPSGLLVEQKANVHKVEDDNRIKLCQNSSDTEEDEDAELNEEVIIEDEEYAKEEKEFFTPSQSIKLPEISKISHFLQSKSDETIERKNNLTVQPEVENVRVNDAESSVLSNNMDQPEENPPISRDEENDRDEKFVSYISPEEMNDNEDILPWGDVGCNFSLPTSSAEYLIPTKYRSKMEKLIFEKTQMNQVDSDSEDDIVSTEVDEEDSCSDFDAFTEKNQEAPEVKENLYSMPPDEGECFENSSQDLSEVESD